MKSIAICEANLLINLAYITADQTSKLIFSSYKENAGASTALSLTVILLKTQNEQKAQRNSISAQISIHRSCTSKTFVATEEI